MTFFLFSIAEPKQKPCLSDSSVKGIIKPNRRPEKGAERSSTPVQPPKPRPVCQTEPRATSGSRYIYLYLSHFRNKLLYKGVKVLNFTFEISQLIESNQIVSLY